MPVVTTRRLVLRHFESGDLASLFALYSDPEIRRYFPDGTRTLEETREELEWFRHGHPRRPELGLWAAIDKSTGNLLGRCGLLPWVIDDKAEVELAYLIAKERWGEGLATEAALGIAEHARSSLKLPRLICLITPGNDASQAVARKVGMTFERDYADEFGPCRIYAMPLQSRRPAQPCGVDA